jgi:hypothetical protein
VRWVRTFPAEIPEGRAYVSDGLPRLVMSGFNYVPVLEQLDGDTVIVEWDIAVSFEDRDRFTELCSADPDRVHVAPYQLYPVSTHLPGPVWAHRVATRHPPWINQWDGTCDLFSFGLVYLPHAIVRRYLATMPAVTGDALFSMWHYAEEFGPVPVHWDVRPVHLHF